MTAILIHEFGHFLNYRVYNKNKDSEYDAWEAGIDFFKDKLELVPKDIISTMYECLLSYLTTW